MEGKAEVTVQGAGPAGPYRENFKSDPTGTLLNEMSKPLMRIHAA